MSARRPVLVSTALAALAAATVALPATSAGADPGTHDRAASRGTVAEVRKAIAPYRDVEVARADGYFPVSGCEQSPEGGMGIHFLNPENVTPGRVDPAKPAVLLYAPGRDGLQLLGAEFFAPDVQQPRPVLRGEPFEGPMPNHDGSNGMHYDLHVWTEVANPAGVFAPWNPNVSC